MATPNDIPTEITPLDCRIMVRLKNRAAEFFTKYSDHHVQVMSIAAVQLVIDDIFHQIEPVLTDQLVGVLFEWMTKWFKYHCENLIIYKALPIPSPSDSDALKTREQAIVYAEFTSAIWARFLDVFINPTMAFEFDSDGITIFDESRILPQFGSSNGPNLFTIPLKRLSDANLINLFTVEQLYATLFSDRSGTPYIRPGKLTGHRSCKYSDNLRFDGRTIVKHLLLFMISGLCVSPKPSNLVVVIKTLLAKLYHIHINYYRSVPVTDSTDLEESTIIFKSPNNKQSERDAYAWLVDCYTEIMISDASPERVFNIIFHYCSCKMPTRSPNGCYCCRLCHNQCLKWGTSDVISYTGQGSFYNVLGFGNVFPNPLNPSSSVNEGSNTNTTNTFECVTSQFMEDEDTLM